jgi:2-polyprenyl-3-methyl-5-hydroxy-6-metoxy-1,4-benzoquinol methylase
MGNENRKLYECAECGLHYQDEKTAIECQNWCQKNKSCNLEITKLSKERAGYQKLNERLGKVFMFNKRNHWEKIYSEKKPTEVSWYQQNPEKSLNLIASIAVSKDDRIIDVGGGASVLVDGLLEKGFKNISVLDISENALSYAKQRLGALGGNVNWVVSDATEFSPQDKYDIWHDRAVFHFLTEKADREKYVSCLMKAVKKGGFLILATFAKDGPNRCSDLDVRQYNAGLVLEEFGAEFVLIREMEEFHKTPWGKDQRFNYFLLKRVKDSSNSA